MTTPVIHFLHIPKTAGSSVRQWLRGAYAQDEVCPAGNWDELVGIDKGIVNRFKVFTGHFGVSLAEFLDAEVVTATVLRDPVARTRSHYRHVFRDSLHPRHNYVASQSFEAFVLDQENWPMIENFQARYLVPTPIYFADFRHRLDRAAPKMNRLSVLSEDARYLYDQTYVRERAMQAMTRLSVLGVTEDLQSFLTTLATLCGSMAVPVVAPRENVAPPSLAPPAPLASHVLESIKELTMIDQELHDSARSCAMERCGSTGLSN